MITIPRMPFYWRFKKTADVGPGEPPEHVPFVFDYDAKLGLFIEGRSPRLSGMLSDIYSRHANVGFLQDGHSLINTYGADFWRFLSDLLLEYPAKTVLEVGCGGCVLLERLKEQGCEVIAERPCRNCPDDSPNMPHREGHCPFAWRAGDRGNDNLSAASRERGRQKVRDNASRLSKGLPAMLSVDVDLLQDMVGDDDVA